VASYEYKITADNVMDDLNFQDNNFRNNFL